MKILQLSNSDLNGGAAVASYRLHKALINSSIKTSAPFLENAISAWSKKKIPIS